MDRVIREKNSLEFERKRRDTFDQRVNLTTIMWMFSFSTRSTGGQVGNKTRNLDVRVKVALIDSSRKAAADPGICQRRQETWPT